MELGSVKLTWTRMRELNGATLYLCDSIVGKKKFMSKNGILASGDEAWIHSNIREWLNGDFYLKHFDAIERGKLVKHDDTGDKVFLLSMEEYGDGYNVIEMDEDWWLRPSGDSAIPPVVFACGDASRDYAGYFILGIRPAILVRD